MKQQKSLNPCLKDKNIKRLRHNNMCIAIVKPSGVELPDKNRLKICFDNNPHGIGCGYGSKTDKDYHLVTKHDNFNDFYSEITTLIPNLTKKTVFIHFRYATHGSIKIENCHPFYISETQEYLIQQKPILMHNGVLQLGKLENDKSDTLTLAEMMYKGNLELDNNAIIKSNNKIAIMYADGLYRLYGNWIKEDDGCFYSNGSYRKSLIEYKNKYQNNELNFCDCCGDIGDNYLETDVGYHFCSKCIENENVYLYNCRICGNICTDNVCSECGERENIQLTYWK